MAKKRANNEGSIYQRKDRTWRAQVTVDGRRLSHNGKTKKECQEWLKETLSLMETGLSFEGAQTKLVDFLSRWLVSIEATLRPSTWFQYQQIVRDHIIPYLGDFKLQELRPDHIQRLYDEKLRQGIGKRTVQLTHSVLHRSMVHAVKLGLIGRNPASATMPPKPRFKEMKIFDESQVSRMLVAAIGDRNELLYHMAVVTGMRQSEMLGLQWKDLDWKNRSLKVQRQLNRVRGVGYRFAPPKTKAGRRTIVLGKKSIQKMREHQDRQHVERLLVGNRWRDHDLVFPTTIGTPMDQRNLLRDFKSLIQKAGLPEIRFHDLRHTAASIMLNHGVPLIVVSRRLGHSKPSITLDIYGHLIASLQAEAAEKIDDLITPVEVGLHLNCTYEESPLEE